MTDQKIDPEPPTLAARLSDALKALCFEASAVLNIEEAAIRGLVGHTNVNALRQRIAEGRALLLEVAALTPEPLGQEWVSKVTQDDGPELSVIGAPEPPPPSVPAMPPMPKCWSASGECVNHGACNAADHCMFQPPDADADDGRGLAVDMRDVDRLRDLAAHLAPHRRTWLRAFCDRLATQITETLSLRQSLREAIERCREQVKRTDAAEEELATCCLCEYEFDLPHTPQDRGRQVVCAKCWPHDADARGWQQRAEKAEQDRDALRTALEKLRDELFMASWVNIQPSPAQFEQWALNINKALMEARR